MTSRAGVLLVTPEPVAARMAGPAIRTLELAGALARDGRGGPVTVASLTRVERAHPDVALVAAGDAPALRALVSRSAVVLVQGDVLGLHPWLTDEPVPLVVDAYDPFHLEQLEQARSHGVWERRAIVRNCVRSLNTQLTRADLVLCASDRQRALWLGHLAALGRVNPLTYDASPDLSGLIRIVPFGVPASPPPPRDRSVLETLIPDVDDDHVVLIWGGGLYEWFDPELLVRAVARVAERYPGVRLLFLGTQHPVPGVQSAAASAREAAAETETLDRVVFFHDGWVPYDERGRWLSAADVGVSTHHAHVETEFSFRTRLLDYFWSGLPVISTGGDDLAERAAREGAGAVVPAGNLDALTDAIAGAVADHGWRQRAGRASVELGRRMSWGSAAAPLADFVAAPRRAPDLMLDRAARAHLGLGGGPPPARPTDRLRAVYRQGGMGLVARRALGRSG